MKTRIAFWLFLAFSVLMGFVSLFVHITFAAHWANVLFAIGYLCLAILWACTPKRLWQKIICVSIVLIFITVRIIAFTIAPIFPTETLARERSPNQRHTATLRCANQGALGYGVWIECETTIGVFKVAKTIQHMPINNVLNAEMYWIDDNTLSVNQTEYTLCPLR